MREAKITLITPSERVRRSKYTHPHLPQFYLVVSSPFHQRNEPHSYVPDPDEAGVYASFQLSASS